MMTPNVGGPLLQFHRTGKVRILAVCAKKRLQAAPDIPTAEEAGLPGMVAANLNGLFAPAGVPKDIIDLIANETRTAMADKALQEQMITSGFEPVLDSGPEEAQREVLSELARWTPIVKSLGFKVQ
jgi:tripartite-type tricarboxylate transporter receptor subunit TctC